MTTRFTKAGSFNGVTKMRETIVFVYKSEKRPRTYLYMNRKNDFSPLPEGMLDVFGIPKFVMMFELSRHPNLPRVSPEELSRALEERGYLLRVDTENEAENMINQERAYRGLPPLTKEELLSFFH